jgi:hypothetical protein
MPRFMDYHDDSKLPPEAIRLAAALIPSSLDALVCVQFDVACGCAGSRVIAGRFAGHSGYARPLAVFV